MRSAFDQIKAAEKEAEDILSRARQEIADLKSKADAQKAQREANNQKQLEALQKELEEIEAQAIRQNTTQLEQEWEAEKDRLDRHYTSNSEAVKGYLVKKVLNLNGDC